MSAEDGWRGFIRLLANIKREEELKELLDLFFTHEERDAVAGRYAIVKALLEEKLTQREIAERMNLSISKITRGSNALKIISNHLREALKKLMR